MIEQDIIEKFIIEDLNYKLKNQIEIISAVDVIFIVNKTTTDDIIKNLKNYDTNDLANFRIEHYDISLPYSPESIADQIRAKAKFSVPDLVISLERKIPKHKTMINQMYDDFKSGNINAINTDNNKIIIRFESYVDGVKQKQFLIKDGEIQFDKVLKSNGKKFLPLIN